MGGQQIECAKEALQLFLRSLPACYFDIVSFGTRFQHMFETPKKYDNKSLAHASQQVKSFDANFGKLITINIVVINFIIRWYGYYWPLE